MLSSSTTKNLCSKNISDLFFEIIGELSMAWVDHEYDFEYQFDQYTWMVKQVLCKKSVKIYLPTIDRNLDKSGAWNNIKYKKDTVRFIS